METDTRAHGETENEQTKEYTSILMEMYMMESGRMI